jgi:hypothetical protein
MTDLVKSKFQLVMLPLRTMHPELSFYYKRASDCWQKVWLDLYRLTDFPGPLFLDNLLRQDEAACIFTPQECVGMILFRTVDFSIMDFRKDSYFKEWNEKDLSLLLKYGPKVFVTSYLTVNPNFRNFNPHVKFKSVFLDLMSRRFKESHADVISGITRRDRGINDETYNLGAQMIGADREYMDGRFKVDLIAIYKKDVLDSPNVHVRQFTDSLWSNRIDILRTDKKLPKAA